MRGEYRHVWDFKGLIDVPDLGVFQTPTEKSTRYRHVAGSQLEYSFVSVSIFPKKIDVQGSILSPETQKSWYQSWGIQPKWCYLLLQSWQAQVQNAYETVHTSDLIMHANTSLVLQPITCPCNSCSKEEHIIAKHFYTFSSKRLKLIKKTIYSPRTIKLKNSRSSSCMIIKRGLRLPALKGQRPCN